MDELKPQPDDILRHKLEGYSAEPDPEVWDYLDRKLPSKSAYNWWLLTPWAILLFLTGSGTGGYIAYQMTNKDAQPAYLNEINLKISSLEKELEAQKELNDYWIAAGAEKDAQIKKQLEVMEKMGSNRTPKVIYVTASSPPITNADLQVNKDASDAVSVPLAGKEEAEKVTQNAESTGPIAALKKQEQEEVLKPEPNDSTYFKTKSQVEKEKKKVNKWWAGLFFAPEYIYRNGSGDRNSIYEKPKTDMSFGVDLKYDITSKLSFQTGLQFMNLGERFVINEVNYKTKVDTIRTYDGQNTGSILKYPTNSGDPNPVPIPVNNTTSSATADYASMQDANYYVSSQTFYEVENNAVYKTTVNRTTTARPVRADLRSNYYMLSIPFSLNYIFMEKHKISLFAGAGGSINMLLGGQKVNKTTDGDVNAEKLPDRGHVSGAVFLRTGAAFNVTETIKLTVSPTFRYFVSPVSNVNAAQPYSVGVQFGLMKKL